MKLQSKLILHLRDQILGGLHVGQLRPGDRLPSIRELADELGRNSRTVKAAYDALACEGLVEVRGRSGVFVARQEMPGDELLEETSRWLSEVVADGWRRRVLLPALPTLIQRVVDGPRVRCALVENVVDSIVAFRHELETEWGLEVQVVAPELAAAVADVDVFAATSFCAKAAHIAAAAAGVPLVVLTIHSGLQQAIQARLRSGHLTIIAVDGRFGERMRIAHLPDESDRTRIRVILANDVDAIARLDPNEPVLLTRAAKERLRVVHLPMIFPHSPTLSLSSARALASVIIRKALTQSSGDRTAG